MTKVQFIRTAEGEELAVLSKREYERLTALARGEDAGTARIVREARSAVAAGTEVLLPKAIIDRLAAGENPIRVLRDWRGETQAELAVAVGITQGYLSDLEAGKRKGPVALHQKFARVLRIPVDLLLPISVSDKAAEPERIAKRSQVVTDRRARQQRIRGKR
jgi:transcriptional regulator with XRE-family HTH domain